MIDDGRVCLPILALLDDFPSNGVAIDRWAFSELVYWGVTGRRPGDVRAPAALQTEVRTALGPSVPDVTCALLSRLFTAEAQASPMAPVVEEILFTCRPVPVLDPPLLDEDDVDAGPPRPSRRPRRPAGSARAGKGLLVLVVAVGTVVIGALGPAVLPVACRPVVRAPNTPAAS